MSNIRISKTAKSQYWEFLLYPDSAHPDFRKILETIGCDVQVSPLHNLDKNSDGSFKKPHYHVIFDYGSQVTCARFECDCDLIQGVPSPDPRLSPKKVNLARAYHTHDTPGAIAQKKAHYNIDDVTFYGNQWYKEELQQVIDLVKENSTDKLELICNILEWCQLNNCFSYWHLFNYAKNNNLEWARFLINSHYSRTIIELLKSMNWTLQTMYQQENKDKKIEENIKRFEEI